MTNTDITPEVLRDVADWIDGTGHGLGPGAALRDEADRIDREQADEKRIDELARIFWDASVKGSGFEPAWESVAADAKPYYRAGVRAVLAHLDGDVVDAEVYGVRDNGDVLLTASDAASVKAVLRYLFGRNAGETYPKEDVETLKFYFWPTDMSCTFPVGAKLDDEPKFDKGGDMPKPRRTWNNLRDVPKDLEQVDTRKGRRLLLDGGAWRFEGTGHIANPDDTLNGPFTEVIADA